MRIHHACRQTQDEDGHKTLCRHDGRIAQTNQRRTKSRRIRMPHQTVTWPPFPSTIAGCVFTGGGLTSSQRWFRRFCTLCIILICDDLVLMVVCFPRMNGCCWRLTVFDGRSSASTRLYHRYHFFRRKSTGIGCRHFPSERLCRRVTVRATSSRRPSTSR